MKEEILQRFIETHSELIKLNPDVYISEFLDEENNLTGKLEITVKHPFVFDNLLIPDSFEGINIQNVTIGAFPKEFPDENAEMPLWKWFAEDNYRKFILNHIDEIRKKLDRPGLTEEEALDALTGGIEKLRNDNRKLEEKMRKEHDKHIEFFYDLLNETKVVFEQSAIYQESIKNNWFYSVSATGIFPGKPLIVGFNWGAGQGVIYEPQKEYRFEYFSGLYPELGSLKRTIPYFDEYCPKALYGMQTNFCFFRSKLENDIHDNDLELCFPLFIKYIQYSKPSILISFSNKLRNHLIKKGLLIDYHEASFQNGKRTISALKGHFADKDQVIEFVLLPHPNTPVIKDARKNCWEFCFK